MTIIEHLHDQGQRINSLFVRVADLEASKICTGWVYWREQDVPGKTPKMCIMHSVNASCPMHGTPKPGDRLRVYVGTDLEKQQQVLEAIEHQKHKSHLESQIRRTEVRLRRVKSSIDDVWHIVIDQQRGE
ncbi:MAG: hypothetical protein GY832_21565 [Chloroflexi bacterium]|nr:hypothetical protein [Chloroflexota bacterium]